jgi:hypothetical protein
MIRPWYRSLLFWLGIPGLLFLLWLWFAMPFSAGSLALQTSGAHSFRVVNSIRGQMGLGHRRLPPGQSYSRWSFRLMSGAEIAEAFARNGVDIADQITLIAPVGHVDVDSLDGRKTWWVAHWVLVLVYGLGWSATMFFSQRRKARLLKATTALPQ